jgi:hypothetical protein
MGWHFDKTYTNNPLADGEDINTYPLQVSGNSVVDTVAFSCNGQEVTLELSVLMAVVEDLTNCRILK